MVQNTNKENYEHVSIAGTGDPTEEIQTGFEGAAVATSIGQQSEGYGLLSKLILSCVEPTQYSVFKVEAEDEEEAMELIGGYLEEDEDAMEVTSLEAVFEVDSFEEVGSFSDPITQYSADDEIVVFAATDETDSYDASCTGTVWPLIG